MASLKVSAGYSTLMFSYYTRQAEETDSGEAAAGKKQPQIRTQNKGTKARREPDLPPP
jgi:hypothetical protein